MTAQVMTEENSVTTNGINVAALYDTIDAVKATPAIADFRFRVKNRWMGADCNRTTITGFRGACAEQTHAMGPFEMENGEPPILLGAGAAANPVEYVLHALAGCLTTTMAYHAAARGVVIEDIQSELEGELDLRGFLGLSNKVRKGFQTVRVRMQVRSDADAEMLRALAQYSPVYDIVSNSLPVEVTVEKM